jgi:hypothetical protein
VKPCFECGKPAKNRHHVVPRILGGKKTVPLCDTCHSLAHGRTGSWNTSELTKAALEQKREEGRFTGGRVPFGYMCQDGQLYPCEPDIGVRQLIMLWRSTGSAFQKIAKALDVIGVPTKTQQSRWKEATIRKICARGLF